MQHFYLQNSAKGTDNLKVRSTAGLERLLANIRSEIQRDDDTSQKYRRRLDHEIAVLDNAGLHECLLIIADIAGYASSRGFLVGPGRGTIPGSLVAFCLGITTIDPIFHNLVFERFLNPKRPMTPHIELDICPYGFNNLSVMLGQISEVSPAIAISVEPGMDSLRLGVQRHGDISTPCDCACPDNKGQLTLDLRKLDILGVIHRTLKNIEDSNGSRVDIDLIPPNDRATFELLSRGDTSGVFQAESKEMSSILQRFKPATFEDLVAILSLHRPGPCESGMMDDFINRKLGRTPVECLPPELEPILAETCGLIIYEEQVIQIATAIAGYTEAEADLLRRALVRNTAPELAHEKGKFVDGATQTGIDHEKASEMFELLRSSNGYTFSKAHSVAYGAITYRSAYMKSHYRE